MKANPTLLLLFLFGCTLPCLATPDAPVTPYPDKLIVELDEFGFKGDLLFTTFEKAIRKAFTDNHIPTELEIKRFPVKDYEGHAAMEIKLNLWAPDRSGERVINFWATYRTADNQKTILGIIQSRQMSWDITYGQLVRNLEALALESCQSLVEKWTTHLNQNQTPN
jgi:hypothetical protein